MWFLSLVPHEWWFIYPIDWGNPHCLVVGWLQWVASTGPLVRLETMLSSVRNRCAARSCSGPDEQITSGHGIVDS